MKIVRVEIAHDNGCWFVQDCAEVNLVCWSDNEADLRKNAIEAIHFTLESENLTPEDISIEFFVVPVCQSEMA